MCMMHHSPHFRPPDSLCANGSCSQYEGTARLRHSEQNVLHRPLGQPMRRGKSDVGNDSICFRTRTSNTMSHAEFSRTFTQIAVRRVTVEKGAHLLIVDARAEGMV